MNQRWWKWERRKEDLKAELEAHIRLAVEDRVARGEDPAQARAAALLEIGNLPLVADTTRRQWGWQALEHFAGDLRHATRRLYKSPGYSITVLLTLTLAIGANTAVFGLLYALMLRSLPIERPDRIIQVKMLFDGPALKGIKPNDYISGAVYDALAAKQVGLSGMCAWESASYYLRESSGTHPVPAANITGDCFRTLGLRPALGRLFNEADDKQGGGPAGYAAVLSYDYWHGRLGGDPGVLGRTLNLGNVKAVVVGVLQPGFESPLVGTKSSIFLPAEVEHDDLRNPGSADRIVLGRLQDGVTIPQVQARAEAIYNAELRQQTNKAGLFAFDSDHHVQQATDTRLVIAPGATGSFYQREQYTRPLMLIEGLVGLSLLVACAYLATLASTRARARRRDLGVRLALGASRARLAAEMAYETALLALAGVTLGIGFAWGAGRLLVRMVSSVDGNSGLSLHTEPTGMVLVFALGVTAAAVLLAGIAPAWAASRVDPASAVKEGEARVVGRRRTRIGAWLTPLQIAMSLVIVVVASLMASTVARLLSVDPGFNATGVSFTLADFSDREDAAPNKPKDGFARVTGPLQQAVLDRIRNSPGVQSAAITQTYQFSGSLYMRHASATQPGGQVRTLPTMANVNVTPGYFQTLGIPLERGRDFSSSDAGDAPDICILSRAAASYFFPGQDAVGKTLDLDGRKGTVHALVVGIVGNTLYAGLREQAPPVLYQPFFGHSVWSPWPRYAVRAITPAAGIDAVHNAFRELAPDVPLDDPDVLATLVRNSAGRERMVALLAGFFAVLTLVLSAIGIYGLLNHQVLERRREIGVRMALGASRSGVIRLVLDEALWMIGPGLLLGAAGAWGATRFLRSMLYGVQPLDPWMCGLSLLLLTAAGLVAAALPARRAATVDPLVALRHE